MDTVRRAGLDVDLQISGDRRSVPPAVELSSYRIIQEALTNTLKHGGLGARSAVDLTYSADKLLIEVSDTGLGHAHEVSVGHGLIGIGERVALFGGRVDYGNREDAGLLCSRRVTAYGYYMIRVALADDQALVRTGLRMILEAEGDIEIVGEATDGNGAIALSGTEAPDVLLMDIRMPGLDGIEALRRISAMMPNEGPRVIMLTTFDPDDYIYDALAAGASGFLLKDAPAEELLTAVRVVASGEAVLAPSITNRLIQQIKARPIRTTESQVLESLTDREREVLRLIAKGDTNQEIAEQLFVGETTVKTHVSHVLQKLGLRDRVQAVVVAYECGFVVPGA